MGEGTIAGTGARDWDPDAYSRFRDLRLRPALDLIARIPTLPERGKIIDLGCGNGAVAEALSHHYPKRKLVGVDNSEPMLQRAAATGAYHRCDLADIAQWTPNKPPAMIFSNAALHWLPDHAELFPRLAGSMREGGVLAVQMPAQQSAPSHRILRDLAQEMFPDRFDFTGWVPPVASPVEYAKMLSSFGAFDIWSTEYLQQLAPTPGAHPVRRFTESTAMRPFLTQLGDTEAQVLIERYESALEKVYPSRADGSVLFPFRRLFIVLTLGG
ncbi:MAG: methyltransferase domain-containing protein [Thioclava marina]|jgi:Trans-aconitate methyltransferase|uniref:Trans-aconitate methyltransferase n=1 Tax=Thioclava marina TaxID=1915077 RepID=A0ABX3MPN1_9RHOB|nr:MULTISPECIES: methyltransferase domain-containing protein [Thioclava]TNE85217.1 MAG: methyltransferase domain-containing protein [Paracoccaceae bacterium]MBC7147299.1 methyltransferase domain-containing protein [Thioclava marina]MBD3801999.1 methyltransferase domain-containing protein [Thioclava sp.]OOY12169.1 trans-aconitate methyltransferase [Thioclava marina]OOY27642.1 trans-aconitate methyltransferase [Thioclava sp. L04-15]